MTNRGQSNIEAAVMMFGLLTFVSALLSTLYLVYSSYWIEHILYESLICYQERDSKSACVHEAEASLKNILFIRKDFSIFLQSSGSSTKASLKVKIWTKVFSFSKELKV